MGGQTTRPTEGLENAARWDTNKSGCPVPTKHNGKRGDDDENLTINYDDDFDSTASGSRSISIPASRKIIDWYH